MLTQVGARREISWVKRNQSKNHLKHERKTTLICGQSTGATPDKRRTAQEGKMISFISQESVEMKRGGCGERGTAHADTWTQGARLHTNGPATSATYVDALRRRDDHSGGELLRVTAHGKIGGRALKEGLHRDVKGHCTSSSNMT